MIAESSVGFQTVMWDLTKHNLGKIIMKLLPSIGVAHQKVHVGSELADIHWQAVRLESNVGWPCTKEGS